MFNFVTQHLIWSVGAKCAATSLELSRYL